MPVHQFVFQQEILERVWIVQKITELIKSGIEPQEIAVLSRSHKSLYELTSYLKKENILFEYERGENILLKPLINQIITICRYIYSMNDYHVNVRDDLLPAILSYEFWGIDEFTIWEISVEADQKRESWLNIMLSKEKTNEIAKFLIYLAKLSQSGSAREIFDCIIGSTELSVVVEYSREDEILDEQPDTQINSQYISPFKKYYFDQYTEKSDLDTYIEHLGLLQSLFHSIETYYSNSTFSLSDALKYIDLLEANNLRLKHAPLITKSSFGVNLLTVHKAKGMEFGHVFVINCTEEEWIGSKKGLKISFPGNLPLLAEEDCLDDKIRLLYVAVTRAKDFVYMTRSNTDNSGKILTALPFVEESWEEIELSPEEIIRYISTSSSQETKFEDSRKKLDLLINKLLETYQLSVTHLLNFLDLVHAGPAIFFEVNILKFPQQRNRNAAYGIAVHQALQTLFFEFFSTSVFPSFQFFLDIFQSNLKQQKLFDKDREKFLEKARIELKPIYEYASSFWSRNSLIEYSIRDKSIQIDGIPLSGSIDRIDFTFKNELCIVDYKTGKPLREWVKKGEEGLKSWRYQTQLHFYKILLENSKEFSHKYSINKGKIEFIQSESDRMITLESELNREDSEKMYALLRATVRELKKLNFMYIDISKYNKNLQGIESFCEDLINDSLTYVNEK